MINQFRAHNEGQLSIAQDHFTKEDSSVITILLPTVPFYTLGSIVTNNLANVEFVSKAPIEENKVE